MTGDRFAPPNWSLVLVFALLFVTLSHAEDAATVLERIKWQNGPAVASVGSIAQVQVPDGYVFADAADTRTLMELMHNPTNGSELGFLAPSSLKWFVVFEFDDVGYVRDDEKSSLDADALLKQLIQGTEAGNAERRKRGWKEITITGWDQPPKYNSITHNLEWAFRGDSGGSTIVNRNTRLLGRKGVMQVTLVVDPPSAASVLPLYDSLLAKFSFDPGLRYTEVRAGDKIAEYGLAALVAGGAAAVAAKSGLFKWLWKGIVLAVIVIGSFVRRLLKGAFGRKPEEST